MTLRNDIINFQLSCNGVPRKRLLIRTPLAVVEALNPLNKELDIFDANSYTSDDTADYLYLKLFPIYDIENDQLGESGFRNTFSRSAVFAPTTTRRGFKATIKDSRSIIFDTVRRLVEISKSSSFNIYSPIKVIDFCYPELISNDTFTFNSELATVRHGLVNVDSYPSFVKNSYLNKEWTFSFKEAKLRLS